MKRLLRVSNVLYIPEAVYVPCVLVKIIHRVLMVIQMVDDGEAESWEAVQNGENFYTFVPIRTR